LHHLHDDGIVGPLTWACLFYPQVSRRDRNPSPEKQAAIAYLQTKLRSGKFLKTKNFLTNDPEGWFGRQTERAVKRFQATYGLKPDGIVGAWTWTVLLGVWHKTEEAVGGSLLLSLRHHDWSIWEPCVRVLCVLLGIQFSDLLTTQHPNWLTALVTAFALTCVTPFLLKLLQLPQPIQPTSPLLQYAPFVLTGIFWKPMLITLEALLHQAGSAGQGGG
jgi:peptidoglycan hydrolase-like protein with peptidoglycan-binding domain